jgi:hypothetical protein
MANAPKGEEMAELGVDAEEEEDEEKVRGR